MVMLLQQEYRTRVHFIHM